MWLRTEDGWYVHETHGTGYVSFVPEKDRESAQRFDGIVEQWREYLSKWTGKVLIPEPVPSASTDNTETTPWQSIETAPKDGTLVDLWANDNRWPNCAWTGKYWFSGDLGQCGAEMELWGKIPTHWMPIPPPPTAG